MDLKTNKVDELDKMYFYLKKIKGKFTDNYQHQFENSLFKAKGGLIVMFLLITIIYQIRYEKSKKAQTFFTTSSTRWKVLFDASITFLLGALTTAFIWMSRVGPEIFLTSSPYKPMIIVGLILGLFVIAQESSGFNRYMAKKETSEGKGPYSDIDKGSEGGTEELDISPNSGDPFLNSISTLSIIILGVGLLYFTINMFIATYYGYKSEKHNISDLPGMFKGTILPIYGICLELFIVVLLNSSGPLISSKLRNEPIRSTTLGVTAVVAVIAFTVHLMIQWNGMMPTNTL
jgi:hypothetical protein